MAPREFLTLDGNLLRLFVTVYETGSVSRAAERIGVNQSSVSHGLDRLRRIVGDPLFVRSGRGIVPTVCADGLFGKAQDLLANLERFAEPETFDPATATGTIVIAANDYEVETVLRPLHVLIRKQSPAVTLHIVRAQTTREWSQKLRDNGVDLVLAPTLSGDSADLAQQSLFDDHHVCLFDSKHRNAPRTLDDFCNAKHAVMLPGRIGPTDIDRRLEAMGRQRSIAIAAPSFAMLAAMIKGTDIIATMPSRLADGLFTGFQITTPPIQTEGFSIAQIWHIRNKLSARHRWLRDLVRQSIRLKQAS